MRLLAIFFACLLSLGALQSPDGSWTRHIKVQRDVPARMRDGVTLYADVYRPDQPGRFPALLMRTPYDKDGALQSGRQAMTTAAVRRGYVVVVQDARGQFKSEGRFVPYAQEIHDGYDTIEWVAALPYVNGKVGTFGLSYPGAVQWMTAPQRPPHLAAISPAMTFANGRHFFHYGGVFDSSWIDWLLERQIRERKALGLPLTSDAEIADALLRDGERWKLFLPFRDLPLMEPFAYWREWLDHPIESDYWKPYDIEAQHHLVQVPALNLTGWNDDGYGQPGAIGNFVGMRQRGATEAARRGQRLVIGPWTHGVPTLAHTTYNGVDYGPNAGIDFTDTQLRFFDYWLKGEDAGYTAEAPIKIFVMGDNVWRDEQEWPLARTVFTEYFLRSNGQLLPTVAGDETADTFRYDPRRAVKLPAPSESGGRDWRELTSRDDVRTFTTETLSRDMELTGQIVARLWFSSSARDTDVSVKIFDVNPTGHAVSLASGPGLLRARYRSTEGSPRPPQPLVPGEATELTVSIGYTSYVIRAGHRLQVSIGGSIYPDVNLNTWEPFRSMTQAIVATNSVYHDRARPSRIVLPVIPR